MSKFLLPFYCKFIGLLLILAGIVFSALYFWFDFRFTMPVFAVFSSFMEIKMFAVFRTNFADELIMLLFISGLSLLVFSKEKVESETLETVRYKALVNASISNSIFLILSILFVFGSGFIGILVINLFSFLLFYLLYFYIAKRKATKE
jgi:hypothetical protein